MGSDDVAVRRQDGLSRRDLLKRGAVVGVAVAWTVPVVQVVGMTAAHADSPRAPNVPPPNNPPPPVNTTPPTETAQPPAKTPNKSAPVPAHSPNQSVSQGSGALAQTGTDYPVGATVGIGTAAIALGAGALTAAQLMKKRQVDAASGDTP